MRHVLGEQLGEILARLGLGVGGDVAAAAPVLVRVEAGVRDIGGGSDLLERVGELLGLVQDVRELVVDGLDVIGVQVVVQLGAFVVLEDERELVHAGEHDLLAGLGGAEDDAAVVAVLPGADQEEHLGEVGPGEGHAGDLVIRVDAQVLDQVRIDDGRIDVGRDRIVTHVGLVQRVAVLELDVVGLQEVHLQPPVEVVHFHRGILDHALRLDHVTLTGRGGEGGQDDGDAVYQFLHNFPH